MQRLQVFKVHGMLCQKKKKRKVHGVFNGISCSKCVLVGWIPIWYVRCMFIRVLTVLIHFESVLEDEYTTFFVGYSTLGVRS